MNGRIGWTCGKCGGPVAGRFSVCEACGHGGPTDAVTHRPEAELSAAAPAPAPAIAMTTSPAAEIDHRLPLEEWLAAVAANGVPPKLRECYEFYQAHYVDKKSAETPIPMLLICPECSERHIDEGEFATKPHHTHACQICGHVWRPAKCATVGVQFLPGFKNEEPDRTIGLADGLKAASAFLIQENAPHFMLAAIEQAIREVG